MSPTWNLILPPRAVAAIAALSPLPGPLPGPAPAPSSYVVELCWSAACCNQAQPAAATVAMEAV
eukprot:2359264-Alexandrium_andersonii.AAC.1